MSKGYVRKKEVVRNECFECGEPATVVMVAKTKWTREQKIPTGIMWECKNGHRHRQRKHWVDLV